jgi:transcriptional regulator with XRE-family HTH domain
MENKGKTIGEKIRLHRMAKGYSQEYMGFALEITQSAYSNLERGESKPTLERIYEIAEILEISPFELMPPPKFGIGINQEFFWYIIHRLRKFWVHNIMSRIKSIPQHITAIHSDKSKLPYS